uniref:Uncharacterized protein n=1 Tax=Anguilla anguilla TaxID=7936 RepID=A0A0E9WKG9_ANGAN
MKPCSSQPGELSRRPATSTNCSVSSTTVSQQSYKTVTTIAYILL